MRGRTDEDEKKEEETRDARSSTETSARRRSESFSQSGRHQSVWNRDVSSQWMRPLEGEAVAGRRSGGGEEVGRRRQERRSAESSKGVRKEERIVGGHSGLEVAAAAPSSSMVVIVGAELLLPRSPVDHAASADAEKTHNGEARLFRKTPYRPPPGMMLEKRRWLFL